MTGVLFDLAVAGLAGWVVGRPAAFVRSARLPSVLLLASVLVFLAVPELLLRAQNFRFEGGVEFAPGAWRHAFARFVPDEELFWRWDPRYSLNSLGYPSQEPVVPKATSVFRILYLGDSCTYQDVEVSLNSRNYPALVDAELAPVLAQRGRTVDTVNLALPGYSSYQGRRLAQRHAERLAPDLAVLYFGWNDHFPAFGAIDAEKKIRPSRGWGARAWARAQEEVRILQALNWARVQLRGETRPIAELRVPIDQYEANLDWMGRHLDRMGAGVLLVTAPTSHYRFGVPRELVEEARFGPDGDTIVARHRAYNQRVRDLAAGRGWHLLDLERDLDRHPRLETLFWRDGIHFSAQGQAYAAHMLSAYVTEHVLRRR